MFEDGLTVKVYGLLLIPLIVTGVLPSVYVTLHGLLPVNVRLKVALCPLQTVVLPLSETVGRAFTVITALPVISDAIAVHLLSLNPVTVYVFVLVGDTENV